MPASGLVPQIRATKVGTMALKLWRRAGGQPAPHPAESPARGEGRVSVVVPLYNHERFIAQAIESVIAQGQLVGEIVVVDDGSSDDSAAVMRALCKMDPRIIFWSQPNRGAHAAINAGLQRAGSDLLAILNSDDVYAPERLATLVAALDADPGADIAASGLAFIDGAGETIENAWYEEAREFYRSCGELGVALINGNFLMTTSNLLMRRRLLAEIGLFAPLRYMHDADFVLRAIAGRKRLVLADEKLLHYRIHRGNTISENHNEVRLEWAIVAAAFLGRRIDAAARTPLDWWELRAITDVLQRHRLAPAVQLCTLYMRRSPAATLEWSPLLLDTKFRAVLRQCL
jgi:glycosyltransferase involved in cell wall biosynthesis